VYLSLLISFVCLVFASWCIGEGGDILGKKYDASIIGGLVIAWLNTAPETIFFLFALEGNNPRFAIVAVSGSTVVVTTIALGFCLYIGSMKRKNNYFYLIKSVKSQCLILLISGIFPLIIAGIGYNIVVAVLGSMSYLMFVIYELVKNRSSTDDKEPIVDVETGGIDVEEEESGDEQPTWKGVLYLVIGGGLILLFSDKFITSIVSIAKQFNINTILLSFFLAPIASEMPEILESISLARKGSIQSLNVAFSNLVGGTISKTTLLCGIFSFYGIKSHLAWESPNFNVSLILLSASAIASSSIGYFFSKQKPYHSYILFVLFFIIGTIQFLLNREGQNSFLNNNDVTTTQSINPMFSQ